uniref:F-box domain-containing protein n=1 Tax=Mycena chlorophos TaxID=658473 RepID=A0ABQ0L950_MYCCL|nr:predicted protein [Mycena chlorophos]
MTGISSLRREISELEDAVSQQTALISNMNRKLQSLQHELRKTATYPVCDLPPEILSEIFLYGLPATLIPTESVEPFDPKRPSAPLLFPQICRAWRRAALATPELWKSLAVCMDETPDRRSLHMLDVFAERARALPLNLALWAMQDSAGRGGSQADEDAFSHCLERNAHRIGSLALLGE